MIFHQPLWLTLVPMYGQHHVPLAVQALSIASYGSCALAYSCLCLFSRMARVFVVRVCVCVCLAVWLAFLFSRMARVFDCNVSFASIKHTISSKSCKYIPQLALAIKVLTLYIKIS